MGPILDVIKLIKWVYDTAESGNPWAGIFLLLVIGSLVLIGGRTAISSVRRWFRAPDPSPPSAENLPQQTLPEPPEKRVYVSLSPRELWRSVAGQSDLDADLTTKRHRGKWLCMEATVVNVKRPEQGILEVFAKDKEMSTLLMLLRFDAAQWQLHFQSDDPTKQNMIHAGGKIVAISDPYIANEPAIVLEQCELTQQEE